MNTADNVTPVKVNRSLSKKLTALEAKSKAQQIAFAPVVFKVAMALRNMKILSAVEEAGDRGLTLPEIHRFTGVSIYGLHVLLDGGVQAGLLDIVEERYLLTYTGHFYLNDEMTRVNADFVNDVCYKALNSLEESIATGSPHGLKEFGKWKTVYEGLSLLPDKVQQSWFAFDHFYSDDVFDKVIPKVLANKPSCIIDIGGNTGKFAIKCIQHQPSITVTIVDLPAQLEMAKRNTWAYFLNGSIQLYTCDMLHTDADLPKDADVIWMSQFLDCFSEEQIVAILKRCCAAMSENTVVYILEPLTDAQKFDAAAFVVQLTSVYFTVVANGNSRMYALSEFEQMIKQAGLEIVSIEKGLGICQTLITCRKKM
ncbi:MAG: methyltransferase domain-containing protein [Chitinophagales bacterium]|nr:methyltransferase domain-containing protein [Chitinophagales bacterium]